MKDQYVGDLSDYRKYGLLRGLCAGADLRLAICWMRTPNDSTGHGGATGYLGKPKMRQHDPELFDALKRLDPSVKENKLLANIEKLGVLPSSTFMDEAVPRSLDARAQFHQQVVSASRGHDLVFFDPDNGVETKRSPRKTKRSDKHVYFDELHAVFEQGCSVLTYQTLRRKKRDVFIPELVGKLGEDMHGSEVFVFTAGHVGFFLVCQHRHAGVLADRARALTAHWKPQITIWKKSGSART